MNQALQPKKKKKKSESFMDLNAPYKAKTKFKNPGFFSFISFRKNGLSFGSQKFPCIYLSSSHL